MSLISCCLGDNGLNFLSFIINIECRCNLSFQIIIRLIHLIQWFIFRISQYLITIIIIIQRIVYLYNILFLESSSSIIFINELLSETTTHYRNFFQIYSHYVKIIPENSSNIIEFIFFFFRFSRYLFHQRRSTQSRSRSFFQTYFHRQHRLNFSLDWPQSRYLFPHPLPDFPDAFSRRSVRLGYPWRRNGGWNSPLKPAAGERLRRFKPRLWCPGQDLLGSRAEERRRTRAPCCNPSTRSPN